MFKVHSLRNYFFLVIVLCSSLLSGCKSKYVGTWTATASQGSAVLDITSNGDCTFTIQDKYGFQSYYYSGNWKETGDGIQVNLDDDDGKTETTELQYNDGRLKYTFEDDDGDNFTLSFVKDE